MAGGRAILGDLAVRDAGFEQAAHRHNSPTLNTAQRDGLADILKRLTTRYDNLFEVSFPYSMGFHQPPTDGQGLPALASARPFLPAAFAFGHHPQIYGRLRTAGNAQRDITAESGAERLHSLSDVHYRQ